MSHWKNHFVLFQICHTAVQMLAVEGTGCAWRTGVMDALLEHEGETPKPPASGLDAALMVPRGCWMDPLVLRVGFELSRQGQHGREALGPRRRDRNCCFRARELAEPAGKMPVWLGFREKQETGITSSIGFRFLLLGTDPLSWGEQRGVMAAMQCRGLGLGQAGTGWGGWVQPTIWQAQRIPAPSAFPLSTSSAV